MKDGIRKYLKMSVIGAVPFLMAIDDMMSAVSISVAFTLSFTTVSAILYLLRNTESRLKYLSAVLVSAALVRLAFAEFPLLFRYGWHPSIFVPLCSISIPGLYLGRIFNKVPGFSESLKYFCLSGVVSITLLLTAGAALTIFGHDSGFVKTCFFAYPGAMFILAGVMALAAGRAIEKLI